MIIAIASNNTRRNAKRKDLSRKNKTDKRKTKHRVTDCREKINHETSTPNEPKVFECNWIL
jgi:hypothetical protein